MKKLQQRSNTNNYIIPENVRNYIKHYKHRKKDQDKLTGKQKDNLQELNKFLYKTITDKDCYNNRYIMQIMSELVDGSWNNTLEKQVKLNYECKADTKHERIKHETEFDTSRTDSPFDPEILDNRYNGSYGYRPISEYDDLICGAYFK